MGKIIEPEKLQGKYVNLREVTVDDAEFILSLRCDPKKSRYLNPTEYNIPKQQEYIRNYLKKDDEWYFIVENKNHKPLGTERIYGVKGNQFTSGSWLMIDDVQLEEVMEGGFLLRNYAFNVLGFEKDYFDVRKDNKKVVRHHKSYGAKIVGESDIDYFFEYYKEQFNQTVENTKRILEYEVI